MYDTAGYQVYESLLRLKAYLRLHFQLNVCQPFIVTLLLLSQVV